MEPRGRQDAVALTPPAAVLATVDTYTGVELNELPGIAAVSISGGLQDSIASNAMA